MLQIPKENIKDYDSINSIDEAVDVSKHLYQNQIVLGPEAELARNQKHSITIENEFWAHCSNLQAWAEYNYDTRLLHSNLAFPLLKKLKELGDIKAKQQYKDELSKRFFKGSRNVKTFLIMENFVEDLTNEELESIFLKSNKDIKKYIFDEIKKSYIGEEDDLMSNIECNKGYLLLNRLADLGDTQAQEILKEQISTRLKTGDVWIICAFINMDDSYNFLRILNDYELESIVNFIRTKLEKKKQDIFNKLEIIAKKDFQKLLDKSRLNKEEFKFVNKIENILGEIKLLANGYPKYSNKRQLALFFLQIIVVLAPFNRTNNNYISS